MERLNKFDNEKFERAYGQLAISSGLRLFSNLEEKLHYRYEPIVFPPLSEIIDGYEDDIEQPSDKSLHKLHLLNWFALFLAQSDRDSTAVAIESKDKAFIVHIAINKEKLDDSDRQRAKTLLSCVYQAIGHGATGAQGAKNARRDILIRCLSDHCWPMISHRLQELQAAIKPSSFPGSH